MSIASDVRSYADSALEQGKHAAAEAYADLRTRGEALYERVSTLPVVERATAVAEPYVSQVGAQLNGYRATVTDKVEQLYADLKKNDQVAKVLGVAETAAGVVVETVNERVVTPVKSILDREPATEAKPTPATAPAPAATTATPAAPATTPAPSATAAPSTAATSPAKAAPAKRATTRRTSKA